MKTKVRASSLSWQKLASQPNLHTVLYTYIPARVAQYIPQGDG